MPDDTTRQAVVFNDLLGKQVVAQFDQPDSSSDGGALLLKACDERLGLTRAIAACIADSRQPGKVVHSLEDLVRQRIFAIACGYEDCNDAARLSADPSAIRSAARRWPRSRRSRALRMPLGPRP